MCNILDKILSSWPPIVEELSGEDRDFPEGLMEFFTSLFLKIKDINPRIILQFLALFILTMIHVVTRGKDLAAKHFALVMGLHNMTTSK